MAGSILEQARDAPATQAGSRKRSRLLQRLMLPAVVLLPLGILGMGVWVAWRAGWDEARAELTSTAEAAAEHARRLVELHRLRAGSVNQLLENLSDAAIREAEPDLHRRIRELLEIDQRDPAPYSLYVFDRDGRVLVNSDTLPSPPGEYRDRDYFAEMQRPGAPAMRLGEVTLGRANNQLFFPITLRRERTGNGLPEGGFDGLINISIRPSTIAAGMARLRVGSSDVISLVRHDGSVLARTRPIERPPPWRQAPDTRVRRLIAEELDRFELLDASPVDGVKRLVVYRRLEGLPLYAAVARDHALVVARWTQRAALLIALGVPAILTLAWLAVLVRRAQRDAEVAHDRLEQRVEARTADLAASEGRLRLALEAADLGIWEVDLRTGTVERTPRTLAIFGMGPEYARSDHLIWRENIHPKDRPAVADAFDGISAGQRDRYSADYRFLRPDGRWIWIESRARVVERAPDGAPLRIAGTVQDVTARREAEERRALLAREVDHRAKNALAVVQAALRLTPRFDAETYARAVEGRVSALARAHNLLAAARWTGAELREVLQGELSAFLPQGAVGGGQPRAELSGPPLQVAPGAAQSLSLALHELATNAVKHGALSVPAGRLVVDWAVDEAAGKLSLRWRERGGPPAGQPARSGFGSRLLAATVRDQLGGSLTQDWEPEGLTVEMRMPLSRVRSGEATAASLTPVA
jgi:PAS domain S-box-containing protein